MVVEADMETSTPEGLRPYLDQVLAAFGCGRVVVCRE